MVLDRIKEYIDYKNINISVFERSIGMSNASFGKSLKNKGAIGTDKLEKILKTYSDLNPDWLLTGQGSMLRTAIPTERPQTTPQPSNDDVVALLKEQLKEKEKRIEKQAQEIGKLKERLMVFIEGCEHIEGVEDADIAAVG